MGSLKNCDTSNKFELLSKVARLILVIPQQCWRRESLQSYQTKHSCLNRNGTLLSLMQVKLANDSLC